MEVYHLISKYQGAGLHHGKGDLPRRLAMSLAPSVAVPRAGFNPLPFYIALFCLLWSFAFVAGKIGVTDCPPPILLPARFLMAGTLILALSAFRRDGSPLSVRDVAVFAIL